MNREMSPMPEGSGVGDIARQSLEEARREAIHALLAAEEAEKIAKQARKQASWKIKMYERLVQEYSGQLRLPDL